MFKIKFGGYSNGIRGLMEKASLEDRRDRHLKKEKIHTKNALIEAANGNSLGRMYHDFWSSYHKHWYNFNKNLIEAKIYDKEIY